MMGVRTFLRRHAAIALLIVAMALAVRAFVPAGYMTSAAPAGLTIELCSGVAGKTIIIALPGQAGEREHGKTQADSPCGFAALGQLAAPAADPALLAAAIAFIVALGLRPARPAPRLRRTQIRPPLRAPPLEA